MEADQCFKCCHFEKAITLYEQAITKNETNPIVLNSNISACYYEIGKIKMTHNYQ